MSGRPWDNPEHDVMGDMQAAVREAGEMAYAPLVVVESPADTRIPLQQAIDQVAAQTGLPHEAVEKLARRLLAGVPKPQIRPEFLEQMTKYAQGVGRAPSAVQKTYGDLSGVELASRRVAALSVGRRVPDPAKQPANPHDRRTIRVLGKPYHLAQTKTGLRLQPGESPWT